MKKRIFGISLAAVIALSAGLLGACAPQTPGDDDGNKPSEPQNYVMPTWSGNTNEGTGASTEVAVHDPSVFYDEASSTYYAFGSHFAVASSSDLINWTQEVGDGSNEQNGQRVSQELYGEGVNWRNVLAESVEIAGAGMPSTWAPDVVEHDGTYYMYVSLTQGFGKSKSVISRVSSTKPLGAKQGDPYADEQVIISSTGDGKANCIDPELFYDKDGGLWMVYGSYFGGIYVLELENEGENWGLPKEGQGYGTLLWVGGAGTSGGKVVEGPFVFYNAETDYYYLMVTYGDLNYSYNMRVARSKNPDGPYEDVAGNQMASAYSDAFGNKIAGNFVMGDANGYAAIGHNSVVEKDGEFFVVAHVRRQSSGEADHVSGGHNLYVFQLFFNEDGWPVMNPNRYANEKIGAGMTAEKLAGKYDVVVHSRGTDSGSATFVESVPYTFRADGTVVDGESASVGTWTLDGYYVEITLSDGDWAGTYKGVAAPGWDSMYVNDPETEAHAAFAFTAVSDAGRSLWAVGTFAAQ